MGGVDLVMERPTLKDMYFPNIHETVNKNGEGEQPRYGTARRGTNNGYWSERAIKRRRPGTTITESIMIENAPNPSTSHEVPVFIYGAEQNDVPFHDETDVMYEPVDIVTIQESAQLDEAIVA